MIATHLLQSTVFAAIAGLLTLLLQNNRAGTRYWIWLAASLKFLVPFSLFVEIGHRLSWTTAPVITQPQLSFVMREVAAPVYVAASSANITPAHTPSILPLLWIFGSVAVLMFWLLRWQRVAKILHKATPITEGREFDRLRRQDARTKLVSFGNSIEPGVFGILRPVLYLPAGIADHLNDAQLDAVIAHELTHVRRRDNLTALLHMLVEAIFWFHPLVWWMGSRLIDERERACDEEVVRQGGDPEVYAESILTICRYYLASPLPCTAGISGSDLKERIEAIMTHRILNGLSIGKKIVLSVAGITAIAGPVSIGLLHPILSRGQAPVRVAVPLARSAAVATPGAAMPLAPVAKSVLAQLLPPPPPPPSKPPSPPPPPRRLEFDAASIKPGDPGAKSSSWRVDGGIFTARGISVKQLILYAWGIRDFRLSGAPAWLDSDKYEVLAKSEDSAVSNDDVRQMLQAMLVDRFHLAFHHGTKELPVFQLWVGKKGFRPAPPTAPATRNGSVTPDAGGSGGGFSAVSGVADAGSSAPSRLMNTMSGQGLANLARGLEGILGGPVEDKTGIEDAVEYKLMWNRDELPVSTALDEQLGLRIEAKKGPVDILIIDHIERTPTDN